MRSTPPTATDRASSRSSPRSSASGSPTGRRTSASAAGFSPTPGRCYRSGITYNAPLKRYLWVQIIPGGDTRFKGGFAIYYAPEPWGPWATAFYTEGWDVGPETASLPTKWFSPDGATVHILFSGDDTFSVRKGTLTLVR